MHAPKASRLLVALAAMQKTLERAMHGLTKRTRHRIVRPENPPAGDKSDPVLALLAAAPIDDEPVTDDDLLQIAEGWRTYREGRSVSHEEATRACRPYSFPAGSLAR